MFALQVNHAFVLELAQEANGCLGTGASHVCDVFAGQFHRNLVLGDARGAAHRIVHQQQRFGHALPHSLLRHVGQAFRGISELARQAAHQHFGQRRVVVQHVQKHFFRNETGGGILQGFRRGVIIFTSDHRVVACKIACLGKPQNLLFAIAAGLVNLQHLLVDAKEAQRLIPFKKENLSFLVGVRAFVIGQR